MTMKLNVIGAGVIAALLSFTAIPTFAQTPGGTGPAEKKDSGSLSSGQKATTPSTRMQGENAPVGDTSGAVTPETNSGASGSSSGEAGSKTVPGSQKGMGTSDPDGVQR